MKWLAIVIVLLLVQGCGANGPPATPSGATSPARTPASQPAHRFSLAEEIDWALSSFGGDEVDAGFAVGSVELHLYGSKSTFMSGNPSPEGAEQVELKLQPGEMAKLLHCPALRTAGWGDSANAPFAPSELTFFIGCGCHDFIQAPLNHETINRLEAIKTALPDKAAAKMDAMIAKARQVVAAATTQPAADAFEIECKKPEDRVAVTVEDGSTVFTITSPSGIGAATVERKGEAWPKAVVLRLNLRGLESLGISNGKTELSCSVGRSGVMLRANDKDLAKGDPLCMEIKPGPGGFTMTIPKAMLDEKAKTLKIDWIDFYRG